MIRIISCGAWLMVAVTSALIAAYDASAQDKVGKPNEIKGISIGAEDTLGLSPQIPALQGYALQIKTIVLEPGAHSAYHSHAERPVVAYLVRGDYTEHRDGEGTVTHRVGEQWIEGADVAHWSENRGDETTILINVEVVAMQ